MNSDLSQVIISPGNLEDELRESEIFDPATYFMPEEREEKASSSATEAAVTRPTDEVEAKLAQIWSNAFGIEQIGVHENFFEIGGYSLLAARIVAQVERAFSRRLSIASIFRTPTIAQLAATLRGVPAPHVVPFHARSRQRNSLLWLGGGALFNPLARHLESELAMVSVTLPDESLASFVPPYRLEDIARCMAETILEIEPEGPYFLGGWSLGGLLVYETARQLELQGKGESLVILVDSPMPTHGADTSIAERIMLRMKREMFHLSHLWKIPWKDRSRYVRGRFETLKMRLQHRRWKMASNAAPEDRPQERLLDEILFLSSLSYRPSSFSGPVLFLQPQLRPAGPYWDLALDWRELLEHLDVVEVPGNHTSMFHEPNVRILAEIIRSATRDRQLIGIRIKPVSEGHARRAETVKSS